MRLVALVLMLALAQRDDVASGVRSPRQTLLADLAESIPRLFVDRTNEALRGKISARVVRYEAPSSVVLEDAILTDPKGTAVALITSARATLSLRALLSGDIVISRIDVVEPRLLLERTRGKLNLLEALSPNKPPEKDSGSEAAFRIDVIDIARGSFRYSDGDSPPGTGTTVVTEGINANASLELDLLRDVFILDTHDIHIASGTLKLTSLDLPLEDIRAPSLRIVNDRIDVESVTGKVAGAFVVASGNITVRDPGALDVRAQVDAPKNTWPNRLTRLPFDTPKITANILVNGRLAEPHVAIEAKFSDAVAYGFPIDGGHAHLDIHDRRIQILDGTSLHVRSGTVGVTGNVHLDDLLVDLDVTGNDVPLAVALAPASLDSSVHGTIDVHANLQGKADGISPLRIEGTYTAKHVEISAFKARGDLVGTAHLVASPHRVSIDLARMQGDRFECTVGGDVSLDEKTVALRVHANADAATELVPRVPNEIHLDGVSFDGTLEGPFKAIRVEGKALATRGEAYGAPLSLEARLWGRLDDPIVDVHGSARGVTVAGEELAQIEADMRVDKQKVTVVDALVHGPLLDAHIRNTTLAFSDLVLAGSAELTRVDLGNIHAARDLALTGTATGTLVASGDVRHPTLEARVFVAGLSASGRALGSGPLELRLLPEDQGTDAHKHIVQIAAQLQSESGTLEVVSAMALERRVVNLSAVLTDVDITPFTAHWGTAIAPLEGIASGQIEAWGPLEKLNGHARLRSPEISVRPQPFHDNDERAPATRIEGLRSLGPLLVEAQLTGGSLDARVCGFPGGNVAESTPCDGGERLWAHVNGNIDARQGGFAIDIDGQLEDDALHDLVPALAAREIKAGAQARVQAHLKREPGGAVDTSGRATLLSGYIEPPDALRASLVAPTVIAFGRQGLRIETPAHFASPSKEVDLTVLGQVGSEDLALTVDGTVFLTLAKLFSEQVANASGTARVKLALHGRYDTGVTIDGVAVPSRGAVLTPRAIGEPITFQSGELRFSPLPGDLMRVVIDRVHARIGDGDAQLSGDLDVRTAREADRPWIARWNLAFVGSGLALRLPSTRVEGGFELSLVGTDEAPRLKGRIEITDGQYRRNFELKSFVLAAPPGKASEPWAVTLEPYGLSNLELDVNLGLESFRTRAQVSNFDADMILRGDLHIARTLRLPEIRGAIEAEEGTIRFPHARFEVVEMQVDFPPGGDAHLNPRVHLSARAEVPPGGTGGNDTEIPLDLSLDGDFSKGLNLDLSAIDPQGDWSRSDVLAFILFGKSRTSPTTGADASVAWRALASEVTAAVTLELEQLAFKTLGVDVEIDPSGWRWQLGRRLQLEGAGLLLAPVTSSGADANAASDTSTSDAVRLRLLILDHLSVGKNLSLEGRSGPTGMDLRLSLRIFEE